MMVHRRSVVVVMVIWLAIIGVTLALAWGKSPTRNARQRTQVDYPLELGNQWVYAEEFYSGDSTEILTATYTLTDTIVDIVYSETSGFTLYQVAHEKMVNACPEAWQQQPDNWCDRNSIPLPYYTWYVVENDALYELHQPEPFKLDEVAWKQLVFPLSIDAEWYLLPGMEARYPQFEVDSSLWKVTGQDDAAVQAGNFADCFTIEQTTGGNTGTHTYCPGVGFVERSDIHSGTPFGSKEMLIRYKLSE